MHTHTCSEHRSRCYLLHVLEELRLGGTRIPTHQDVDVSSHTVLAARILGLATKEGEGDGSLDVFMAENRRSYRSKNLQKEINRTCFRIPLGWHDQLPTKSVCSQTYHTALSGSPTHPLAAPPPTYPFCNVLLLCQLVDGPNVFICEAGHCSLVIFLGHKVGRNDGAKDWKPVSSVK